MMQSTLRNFIFPKLTRRYLLRVAAVAVAALLFFGYVCVPCVIRGESMMPTYGAFGVTFCWCPAFWFGRRPRVGDVVAARLVGRRVLLLKRVVALAGDTVEFRNGVLFVNNEPLDERWETAGGCNWELPPRVVEDGCVYLVGDNRSMRMEEHVFGQCPASRLVGKPIW